MSHVVSLELSDELFRAVQETAEQKGLTVEAVVQNTLARFFLPNEWEWGEITEDERRGALKAALEREDLWGSEADKVWDTLPS